MRLGIGDRRGRRGALPPRSSLRPVSPTTCIRFHSAAHPPVGLPGTSRGHAAAQRPLARWIPDGPACDWTVAHLNEKHKMKGFWLSFGTSYSYTQPYRLSGMWGLEWAKPSDTRWNRYGG